MLLIFIFASCHHPTKKMPVKLVDVKEDLNSQITDLISDELQAFEEEKDFFLDNDTLVTGKLLTKFYEKQNYTPAWKCRGEGSENADSLLSIIADAEAFGLLPSDYHQSTLHDLKQLMRS